MSISISSHPQIRQRAYEIFLERRKTGRKGDALTDWLEAEQEIRWQRTAFGRILHFAQLPLNLSCLLPHSPYLGRIRNPIRQPG